MTYKHAYLFATQVWDCHEGPSNIAPRCKGCRESLNGLVVRSQACIVANVERYSLCLDSVVVWELLELAFDIGDSILVTLAANDAVLALGTVRNLLQDLSFRKQVVNVDCFAERFLV
jgi:hypothetical protein